MSTDMKMAVFRGVESCIVVDIEIHPDDGGSLFL
jgi:hypothetical protein